ncbi:MAG: hypothetical protein M1825_001788 [Sarcosagium campestre]|nr:MAG: hypothetical protein M1825_001788 [Sarcosagium campestre]
MLSSGAVIGIAVGGAAMLFIFLSCLGISAIQRRQQEPRHALDRSWSVYPAGNTAIDGQSYSTLPDPEMANHYFQRARSGTTGNGRPVLPWMNQAPHLDPTEKQVYGDEKPDQPIVRDRSRRLSWPLPSRKSIRRLGSLRHPPPTKLSPITESPVLRSHSTPVSVRPAIRATPSNTFEASQRQADSSMLMPPSSQRNGHLIGPRDDPRSAGAQRRTQSHKDRGLPRLVEPWPGSPKMESIADPMQVRRGSHTGSVHSQDPGVAPEAPLPRLPTRSFSTDSIPHHGGRHHTAKSTRSASTSSADTTLSSILAMSNGLTRSQTLQRAGSVDNDNSSLSGSRRSEVYSMFGNLDWEIPLSTRLTSPSKKQKSGRLHEKKLSSSSQSVRSLQNPQHIRQSSCISLDTLGRRYSLQKQPSIIVEPLQSRGGGAESRGAPGRFELTPLSTGKWDCQRQRPAVAGSDTQVPPEASSPALLAANSPLQNVSGNTSEHSSARLQSQDLGATKDKIFQVEPADVDCQTKPVSALKGANGHRRSHKRHNCVRISVRSPVVFGSSPASLCTETRSEHSEPPRTPSPINRNRRPLPHPPALLAVYHEGSNMHAEKMLQSDKGMLFASKTYSSSLAASQRPACPVYRSTEETHLDPDFTSRRISTGSSVFSTPPRADLSRPNTPVDDEPPSPPNWPEALKDKFSHTPKLTPSTTIPQTPNFSQPNVHTVRGPRSPPAKRRNSIRPAEELRRSILALRRMNSDVSNVSDLSDVGPNKRSSSHYLSLGNISESRPLSPRSNDRDVNPRKRISGLGLMLKPEDELYDAVGFLKDVM